MKNDEIVKLLTQVASGSTSVDRSLVSVTEINSPGTDVYCLSVPGTAFVVKSDADISVTGNCHLNFMVNLVREIFDDSPEDQEILTNTLRTAAEHEISWGKSVYGNRILGVSEDSTEKYIKWLANQRAKVVGIPVLFPGFTKNPYAYLDAPAKENFFETTVTEYSQSSAVSGWDDF